MVEEYVSVDVGEAEDDVEDLEIALILQKLICLLRALRLNKINLKI